MGIDCHHETFGEKKSVNVNTVRDILKSDNSFTHVSIVHCETSVGIFNPITEVGKAVRELAPSKCYSVEVHNMQDLFVAQNFQFIIVHYYSFPDAVYFVDAMSTFGAVPLSMVESNIDFMVSSSNKCIEGTPGFSYAIANTKKLLACKGNKEFKFYYVKIGTGEIILLLPLKLLS